MKILLASDSHGNNLALEKIALKHPDMDYYLHLGDSESDEFMIKPFISVRGNNDYGYDFNDYLIIPTPIGNIFACHYPNISKNELDKHNTKFFIHGHTHVRKHELAGNLVKINPGAISYPRDTHYLSYAILTIYSDSYEIIFYELE